MGLEEVKATIKQIDKVDYELSKIDTVLNGEIQKVDIRIDRIGYEYFDEDYVIQGVRQAFGNRRAYLMQVRQNLLDKIGVTE